MRSVVIALPLISMLSVVKLQAETPAGRANVFPDKLKQILRKADHFTLLSLDPGLRRKTRPSASLEEPFHGYRVLGRVDITDDKERAQLLNALYRGVEHFDENGVRACFLPRHGIRATLPGHTVDLVICFQCWQMVIFGSDVPNLLTTDSPRSTFDEALKKAGIQIEPLPREGVN